MTLIASLSQVFAPWQSLYSNDIAVSTAVTVTHIVALLVGGGLAIAADRTTLRALRHEEPDWPYHLGELHAVHRPVVGAMVVLFISGLLLAAADIDSFVSNPVFWIKLGLVALLLINGLVLYRTEAGLARAHDNLKLQRRLEVSAYLSLALWLFTAVAGTVLTNG